MFKNLLINAALNLLDKYLVAQITFIPLKSYIQLRYEAIKKVADIFTDKDPQNERQLQELWEEIDEQTLDDTLELAAAILEGSKSEIAKDLAVLIRAAKEEDLLD